MDEDTSQVQVESTAYSTPLRDTVAEIHEIYVELQAVGFNDAVSSQIVAHLLTEVVLYGPSYEVEFDTDDDEDEDYEDGDFDVDDPDNRGT